MTSPWHIRDYNADFFTFAKDMLTTCANGPDVPGLPVGSANYGELIRWGTWVAVELAARASDNDDLDTIVDALCIMYTKVRCCFTFYQNEGDEQRESLSTIVAAAHTASAPRTTLPRPQPQP